MIFKKALIKKKYPFFFALLISCSSFAQLTTNTSMTPAQLVQNVLLGSGVTASNITYNGATLAIGSFNGSSSNIGLPAGVIMSSGDISNAVGPNNTSGASAGNSLPGDIDLDAIMSPTTSFDATILEFDFVPISDTVKFKYVFGSEEYMEFVSAFPGGINDGFGFFISGPGISGPFSNNSKNIAIIPGTTLPVTMFNLNLNNNSAFYFDNGDGFGTGTAPDGATVQYDGFTVPIIAISEVQCGQTYHIKIAIADGGDDVLDSGVFLEAGSFSSQGVSIIPQISYGGANDSTLFEGCGDACIYFVRGSNISNPDTINMVIAGTAVNGTDYYDNTSGPGTPFPNQLIFAAGQDTISFCITAVADANPEGVETITITVPPFGSGFCIQPAVSSIIYLNEYTPLILSVGNDTTLCNQLAPISLLTNVSGGVPPYSYAWTNGAGTTSNPVVNPTTTSTYVVTVNDACIGSPTDPTPPVTDSVSVSLITIPVITATVSYGGTNDSTFYEGCGQACIYFVRTLDVAQPANYTLNTAGTATNGLDYNPALPSVLIFAAGQDSLSYCINAVADGAGESVETILVSINSSGICSLSANTKLYIDEPELLSLNTSNDTVLNCTTGPVNLVVNATGGVQPYTYLWSNGAGSVTSQTVTPSSNTAYAITVADACSGSPDPTPDSSDTIHVTLDISLPLSVNAGLDKTACPDDVVSLSVATTGGALPFVYLWTSNGADTVSSSGMPNTSAVATVSTVFTITVADNCGNTQNDQVSVNVEQSCLLNIPNVITPDGKGAVLNETFYIENLERFPASSLVIYSRWGNKIFEALNYQNNWNGSKYPDGTYYYVLTVPPSGQVLPKIKPSGLPHSFDEMEIGSDKVFSGFFQIVRAK